MIPNIRVAFVAAVTAAAILILAPYPAFAQSHVVEGQVLDPMRAAIANASVTVTNATPPVSVSTDGEGRFAVSLTPGSYALQIAAPGFAPGEQHITVASAAVDLSPIVLQVAGIQEDVTVTASGGYRVPVITSATRTATSLRDVPQAITVITREQIQDQLLTSVADAVRYVPGITSHQGENNRDQVIIRGNNSSADFFINGVRDDVQYYRDLYNLDRVEALKGPNALMFGRGGAGGVINRVVKEPRFMSAREVALQGGQFGDKRATLDLDQPLSSTMAIRLNAMAEDSDSFRHGVGLQRVGFNPAMTFAPDAATRVTLGYEYLRDRRVADRGITSLLGRPADVPLGTYYGDPAQSHVRADVHIGTVALDRRFGAVTLRNRTVVADYNRGYQNFVPGAPTADASMVKLSAYNNATDRTNVFSQTDVVVPLHTGRVRHTFLAGTELGRQLTDNFRNTGYFGATETSILVPFAAPATTVPVTFRQSATDADNHIQALVGAAFVQDQVELTRHLQVLGGVRFDRFALRYQNNRTGDTLRRADNLVSPRAGIVVKPIDPVSIYGSYSVSYLPSSGDQFSSLTAITQQVKPEKFANYEVGLKWDMARGLAVTTALYGLDRTNTRSTDPNDPTRIIQTGSQRTTGFEAGLSGNVTQRWNIAGGYARQHARVTSATTSARTGAIVGQVPRHTFALWNNYQLHRRLGVALGLSQRSDMFAAIDDTVVLPGYWRADVAAYFTVTRQARLQLNIDNVTDRRYFLNADGNTNISPGAPRAIRVALVTRF